MSLFRPQPGPGWRLPSLRVFGALVIREMITRYGRSPGGYIWAVLEPAGMIAILALAFSQFIHTPPLGESFILFYATGYLPFHAYSEIAGGVSNSVTVNRPLMHFPIVTPLDAVLARFFLSFLTIVIVCVLVFSTLLVITDDPVRLQLGPLFAAIGSAALLGLGVGTLNAVIFAFVPLWQRVWSIINRPLFILSAVFFTYESLPRNAREILFWNPIVHCVGEARKAFYPVYEGNYVVLGFPLGVAAFCFLLGGFLLMRNRSAVIDA
ncbi:ABC transporter permease [Rhodovulum sulfidophilum]|uniref:Putative cell surface polysaccharide export ABC-2 transporter permease protein n=1 Tax=Rhodovulum sulfidophilum TaxID=35806 RepID=A0A0D6AWM7_RHOSU|nr:ABC transporter permease [Rhodovulum sulfidophilum]MBL3573321.1 ABC transporter permease [Rhodovulum sulfidophilum]MBL3596938.1 ABC transporter permease [Rhodovulum sulfidophilum]MCE8420313.1 ABC transporter permease [Rhodovulum sulfidophilum]MCE8430441.1 ABC transporter permease [Rhodovulum sulfidophilum]MCE8440752.1 ABC transporter permease [Rhodovulum sulfidophilum]